MIVVAGISVLLNSLGIIGLGIMYALLSRSHRRLVDEVTELQGVVDMLLITNGLPPMFAERYDVEIVLDPTRLPPPDDPTTTGDN